MSNQNQLAINAYTELLNRQPEHMQANFNLGYTLMIEGNYAKAIPYFQKALELKPDYDKIHSYLSRCADELKTR
ncbi:MAG: tetratricopeptide repeat protein [Deltaproteobacteria bacterium]|nr:tetratricopeptide repeat protein [Deltaproteobacteria bacterium]